MYGCGGGQPPGLGGQRHYFDINHLNREHLRDLPRGLLRRWGLLCDTGAVTSVAPRSFADHVPPLNHTTNSFPFLQLPTNLSTSMATKTFARLQQNANVFANELS